jgi:predicted RNA-binding protein with PUA-like domain
MAKNYWLVKSEPEVYSIADLEAEGTTEWWGVRNYRARNLMRDKMQVGDPVLFYHSNTDPLGVYGIAEVATPAHPDSKQFERGHRYFDEKSTPADPRWWCVDLRHVRTLERPVTREAMKKVPELAEMLLLRRGMRLSVQPVAPAEFRTILELAGG